MSDQTESEHVLVPATRPGPGQMLLAAGVALTIAAALLATAPAWHVPVGEAKPLLLSFASATLLAEVVTAALLLSFYAVQPVAPVLILALGYLLSALLVVPWAMAELSVFRGLAVFDGGLHGMVSLAAARREGFLLCVFAYALMTAIGHPANTFHARVPKVIGGAVLAVVAATGGLIWFAVSAEDLLAARLGEPERLVVVRRAVQVVSAALCLVALAASWKRRSILDLWLMVMVGALLAEGLLLVVVDPASFTVGWWAALSGGLAAAVVVLVVLLSETVRSYNRLVLSSLTERRMRETQLVNMEALSASIAHEVNQPVASMVTNADAGLRWLAQEPPQVEETRAAVKRIVSDGHRAGRVIRSIRAMFRVDNHERSVLDINEVLGEALERAHEDALLAQVTIETDLGDNLPAVTGEPIQLQHVILNLMTNAIDAMAGISDRPRILRLASVREASGDVAITVDDAGPGVDPALRGRIFDPFFTTKSHGMGLGLLFCRWIVEAHGGRLSVSNNVPWGARFRFTLPADTHHAPLAGEAG